MRCYQEIISAPAYSLTAGEIALLELEDAMLSVREEANKVRLSRHGDFTDMIYVLAFFNGTRYTAERILMRKDYSAYIVFTRIADTYALEVKYLAYEYVENRGAR